jgi:valyl-tRNA synthetase
MSNETMPKVYDFHATEQRIYQWWEENGWFRPEPANCTWATLCSSAWKT